jgi:hypothetical protein
MDTAEKFDNSYPYLIPNLSIPTLLILPASLFTITIGKKYYKDSKEAKILTT